MEMFTAIVALGVGAALGSFCNVVVYRLHDGRSPLRGRSSCPKCGHVLTAADLVPVLSFLFLRGKCRYCRAAISWQYPLVELAMAVIATTMVLKFGLTPAAVVGTILGAFLLVVFVYDLKHELILDVVTVPGMVVALVGSLLIGRPFSSVLLGGILGAGFFFIQYAISRGRWIGGGDIRLGAMLGLGLGWELLIVALVLAYLSGSLVAAALLLLRRRTLKSVVPFGTFLSLAGVAAFLWGSEIAAWYLRGGFFQWFVRTFIL